MQIFFFEAKLTQKTYFANSEWVGYEINHACAEALNIQ